MSTYTIEGEMSDHYFYGKRVVHREFTTDKNFADSVRQIGWIEYCDGTRLVLRVIAGKHGKEMNSCSFLIKKCLAQGTIKVSEIIW
jgi:hypothetical protein